MTKKSYQSQNTQKYGYLSLLLIYAIFIYFFYINGRAFFEYWDVKWQASMIMYMVGVSLFLAIYEKIPKEFKKPIHKSIFAFGVTFIVTTCVMISLNDLPIGSRIFGDISVLPAIMIIPTIIFTIGIVAPSEEIIFRGAIMSSLERLILKKELDPESRQFIPYKRKSKEIFLLMVVIVIQAIIFGFFHYAAYDTSLSRVLFAVLMGVVLGFSVKYWNIGAGIGVHAGVNCFLLGATYI